MTLINAFEAVSTEATLAELKDTVVNRSNPDGTAHLVSGTHARYRREFNDPTLADWTVVTGPGMTVNTTGGNLVVTTGTTINSVTTITSKAVFDAPFKASFGFLLSQKIANQEFYVELVADDGAGGTDETVVAAWRVAGTDSVTNTNARVEVRNGGAARLQSGNIGSQVAQTGAQAIYEIVLESDEVWFWSKPADSTSSRTAGAVRNLISPNPTKKYHLRYRIVNGATAPASTTTFTSGFVTALDWSEFQVDVQSGSGSAAAAQAIPVATTNTVSVSGSVTPTPSATATSPSMTKVASAATTNALLLKSTAGKLYGFILANTTATWRYVKFHNMTTAPTVGTSAVALVIALPPNSLTDASIEYPINFSTGLSMSITGGAADNDTTVTAVSDVLGTVLWM